MGSTSSIRVRPNTPILHQKNVVNSTTHQCWRLLSTDLSSIYNGRRSAIPRALESALHLANYRLDLVRLLRCLGGSPNKFSKKVPHFESLGPLASITPCAALSSIAAQTKRTLGSSPPNVCYHIHVSIPQVASTSSTELSVLNSTSLPKFTLASSISPSSGQLVLTVV